MTFRVGAGAARAVFCRGTVLGVVGPAAGILRSATLTRVP